MVDTLAYRQQLRPRLPRWYRGWPHFAITHVLLGGVAALLFSRVHALRTAELLAIPAAFGVSNAVEYLLHRFPLHRPMPPLGSLFKAHGVQHHRFFTGDSPAHMSTSDPHDFAVVLFGPASQLALMGLVGCPRARSSPRRSAPTPRCSLAPAPRCTSCSTSGSTWRTTCPRRTRSVGCPGWGGSGAITSGTTSSR